jgi:hypothetical protein
MPEPLSRTAPLASTPPARWTAWRDRRDGTVVEIVEVRHWNSRIALMPPGGHGVLRVDVGSDRFPGRVRRLEQRDFEAHFDLIYDPYTGWDAAA